MGDRSVPLGKYCLRRRFVFSCQSRNLSTGASGAYALVPNRLNGETWEARAEKTFLPLGGRAGRAVHHQERKAPQYCHTNNSDTGNVEYTVDQICAFNGAGNREFQKKPRAVPSGTALPSVQVVPPNVSPAIGLALPARVSLRPMALPTPHP